MNGEWRRCGRCGCPDTGWRAHETDGARLCPACAQGIRVCSIRDMLAEKRALLKRLEDEGGCYPGAARSLAEVRRGIDTLERRLRDEGGG